MTAMRTILITLVGLALLAPATADAQKKPRKQAPGERTNSSANRSKERRAKIEQRIIAMREWKLTDQLELDTAAAGKLFPILESYDEKFRKAFRRGGKLRRQLRKQIDGDNTSDKQLDKIVDKMLVNQRSIWNLNENRFKAVRKVLSAEQAAKALVVLPKIDHEIRRVLREALDGGKRPFRRRNGHRGRRDFKRPF